MQSSAAIIPKLTTESRAFGNQECQPIQRGANRINDQPFADTSTPLHGNRPFSLLLARATGTLSLLPKRSGVSPVGWTPVSRNPFEPPTATVADAPATQINTAVLAVLMIGVYVALNFALGFAFGMIRLPGASYVWLVTIFVAAEIIARRVARVHGRNLTAAEETRFTLSACLIYLVVEAMNQLFIARIIAPAPPAVVLGRFLSAVLLQLIVVWLICRFYIQHRVERIIG
jgi:hypothetical protein